MKITALAVGTKMPGWVNQGVAEYAKRLPREWRFQLVELAAAKRGKTTQAAQWIEEEAERILAAHAAKARMVLLDVQGQAWSTEDLAQQLALWQQDGRDVHLVIGGPDGVASSVLQRADSIWSLSKLTLPHPLVRIVLVEQLYRAGSVLLHHPYHRA